MTFNLQLTINAIKTSGYITYQVFFHPLAKYPGPFIAKLTDFYSVYYAITGTGSHTLYDLHAKHGQFVRIGPNQMSVCSAVGLDAIYGTQANVKKGTWYRSSFGTSMFNAIDKDIHARKRRVMSHAFSDKSIRDMEPYVVGAIRIWSRSLVNNTAEDDPAPETPEGWSPPRNMSRYSSFMIFDVIGEICFGESFRASTVPDNRYFVDLLPKVVKAFNIPGQMPFLQQINVAGVALRGLANLRAKQVAFCKGALGKRLALGTTSGRKDVFHFLLEARDPQTGEGFTNAELMSESTSLLGAGSDTASTALASFFYFLVHNADILERVTKEIRERFTDVEDIVNGPDLKSLTYLRACIDEAMRLCPPVPTGLKREVLAGGLVVDGEYFPAGCIMSVPLYVLHHSPEHFKNAFKFDPSRWLVRGSEGSLEGEGVTKEELKSQKAAYAPFSTGARACIARNLAMMELLIGAARALWLYDVRLAPGYEDVAVGREGEFDFKEQFIMRKNGPIVQFKSAH